MEDDLAAAVSKYEDDLRDRDQKIVKLKKQMAEAFTGNSMWVKRSIRPCEISLQISIHGHKAWNYIAVYSVYDRPSI